MSKKKFSIEIKCEAKKKKNAVLNFIEYTIIIYDHSRD